MQRPLLTEQHFDVVVIGAGISGIDAAWHLKYKSPSHSFVLLERKQELGGTWSLFNYPGVRSDSDMQTFGFHWSPWPSPKPIAPGADIMEYLKNTVRTHGLEQHIRYNTDVVAASWDTPSARWTLTTTTGETYTAAFLFGCTGYYSHEEPYRPTFAGEANFAGRIVHPQFWCAEDDVAYPGRRVAIIGSGATAVTMLPSLCEGGAAHVTMVQRTPTYIVAAPEVDVIARRLRRVLPEAWAHSLLRTKNVIRGMVLFAVLQSGWSKRTGWGKRALLRLARKELPDLSDADFARHFTPPYEPWDQRLCLSPGGDFYAALRSGRASVTTGTIQRFTERGILMEGGEAIEADLIVTATGLSMQRNFPMSTMRVCVDGEPYRAPDNAVYKGIMLSRVPNFAFTVGYTNASWTLKADLASAFVSRLLNHMRAKRYRVCRPEPRTGVLLESDVMGLSSGYVARARATMPRQGTEAPWTLRQNYFYDGLQLSFGRLEDGTLSYTREPPPPPQPTARL